jgi:hypothetical protein
VPAINATIDQLKRLPTLTPRVNAEWAALDRRVTQQAVWAPDMHKAIHMMALTQARVDPHARAYVARRCDEGRSHREANRALKRHLSDVLYRQLHRRRIDHLSTQSRHRSTRSVKPTSHR